jgi:beta-glucanase (GH16 family)
VQKRFTNPSLLQQNLQIPKKSAAVNKMSTIRTLLHLYLLQTAIAASGDILWRDDFDGTSLNDNYWSYDLGGGGWGNSELQTYTTAAVSVGAGLLNIRADRISTGFTSGRINSDGKVLFRYGTVEARIKIPDSDEGLWPALWTLGENFSSVGWPRSGEIDIMEIGQGLAITEGVVNRRVISGAHWEFEENYAAYALWKTFNVDLNDEFHIYKLDWTPTSLSTYVDGVKVWEMDIDSANCVDCEEFQQPHFLVLNLAVGGFFTSTGGSGSSGSSGSSSSGCPSSSSSPGSSSGGCGEARTDVTAPLPADMLVDWVQIIDNGFGQVFPTSAPTPAPTPGMSRVGSLSTKSPTRRPTPDPTPDPTPGMSRVGSLSTKSPTRRPTPAPVHVLQSSSGSSSSSKGKGGKGKGGSSKSSKKSGKGGKGGKGSKKSSSKGSKKGASITTLTSSLSTSDANCIPANQARVISLLISTSLFLAAV